MLFQHVWLPTSRHKLTQHQNTCQAVVHLTYFLAACLPNVVVVVRFDFEGLKPKDIIFTLYFCYQTIPGGRAAGREVCLWGRDSPGSCELAVWIAWWSISLPGPTPHPRRHGDRTHTHPGHHRTHNWGQMETCELQKYRYRNGNTRQQTP